MKHLFWDYEKQWVILVLCIVACLYLYDNLFSEPTFTIQDVYVYCGKNPEVLITHRGDDCNITMNTIYNENENWTRTLDKR